MAVRELSHRLCRPNTDSRPFILRDKRKISGVNEVADMKDEDMQLRLDRMLPASAPGRKEEILS